MYVYMLNEKLFSRWSLNLTLPVGKAVSPSSLYWNRVACDLIEHKSHTLWEHFLRCYLLLRRQIPLLLATAAPPHLVITVPGGAHSHVDWVTYRPLLPEERGWLGSCDSKGSLLQLSGFPIPRWFLWQTKASSSSCFQSQVVIAACPSPRTHPFLFLQPNSSLFFLSFL